MPFKTSTSNSVAPADVVNDEQSVTEWGRSKALLDVAGRARFALKAGCEAPDFKLLSVNGQSISSSQLLRRGPMILLITHGPWCSTVLQQLEALAKIHPQIVERSASLIVIAPHWKLPEGDASEVPIDLLALPFPALIDTGLEVATAFGLTFQAGQALHREYRAMGYCDPHARKDEPLLIPATYLISRTGEIAFAFIDTDPKSSLKPKALLSMLDSLSMRSDS